MGDIPGALEDLNAAANADSSYVIAYVDRAYAFVAMQQ